MKIRNLLVIAGLACGLGITSVAQASLISGLGAPSSDAALVGGTVVDFTAETTGTYTSLTVGDVTFSSGSADTFVITDSLGGSYNTTGRNLQNLQVNGSTSVLNFVFASTVSAFGFNFGASNEDWSLEALDSSNSVLESYILPQTWFSNAGDYFGIVASGIASVRLTQLTHVNDAGTDWILLDNFTYVAKNTDLPEPSVFFLFALGFLGLILKRSRQ